MHPISRLAAAGFFAIALLTTGTGCSTIKTEFGSPVPFAQIDTLQPGLTTRRQVLAQLELKGTPAKTGNARWNCSIGMPNSGPIGLFRRQVVPVKLD